jgi:hypothetical protein
MMDHAFKPVSGTVVLCAHRFAQHPDPEGVIFHRPRRSLAAPWAAESRRFAATSAVPRLSIVTHLSQPDPGEALRKGVTLSAR